MKRRHFTLGTLALAAGLALSSTALSDDHISESPEGASLYFIGLADGDSVTSPLTVRFGLNGMGVAPAGVEAPSTGHHHLLIDLAELPDMSQPLPATLQVVHFGGGQTETLVELEPGEHSLQLLLGNHLHIPHDPPVISEKITITVTAD